MLFNLSNKDETEKALEMLGKLMARGAPIEIINKTRRTLKQNSYLHVLFGLFGLHFGYTISESKQIVKSALGYTYEKGGDTFCMETSKMTTTELGEFIEKFKALARDQDCNLPSADEYEKDWTKFENKVKNVNL